MPIRAFLDDQSFDPEAIEILNAAYLAVCADLGLTDKTDGATEFVAKKIIDLADGERDPQRLRARVLESFSRARSSRGA